MAIAAFTEANADFGSIADTPKIRVPLWGNYSKDLDKLESVLTPTLSNYKHPHMYFQAAAPLIDRDSCHVMLQDLAPF